MTQSHYVHTYKARGLKINHGSKQSEIQVAQSVQLIKENITCNTRPKNCNLINAIIFPWIFFSYIAHHCLFLKVIEVVEKAERTKKYVLSKK